jgi:gas vesicle protein
MKSQNKLLKGLFIGAIAGAALSLLDKKTRDNVISKSRSAFSKIKQCAENPMEIADKTKEKMNSVKRTIEQTIEDIEIVSEKVKELKETTPKVMEIMKEAKEKWKERL